ncbi:MAG TPA: L,D-transpeptidase family protein [Woeseiaceae bacterium]|nr:L,D-transpeptidase family protein [Woeseiaceae bacterium]
MPGRLPTLCVLSALLLGAGAVPGMQGSALANDFPIADKVVVEKGARKLHLLKGGVAFRSFDIALGIRPVGDKEKEGDFKTPEGNYRLDARNPDSEYFLAIHVSYPDSRDRAEARMNGVDPGGAIMIHGQPNDPTRSEAYYRTRDWTNGCIAVSNSDMIDIWLMTAENTPIEIRP